MPAGPDPPGADANAENLRLVIREIADRVDQPFASGVSRSLVLTPAIIGYSKV